MQPELDRDLARFPLLLLLLDKLKDRRAAIADDIGWNGMEGKEELAIEDDEAIVLARIVSLHEDIGPALINLGRDLRELIAGRDLTYQAPKAEIIRLHDDRRAQ